MVLARLGSSFVRGMVIAIVTVGLCWCAVDYQFGSIRNGLLYLSGYDFVVEPIKCNVGEGVKGETRVATFCVRNISFSRIRVVGALTTCKCVTSDSFPLTIPPRRVGEVHFSIGFTSKGGEINQNASLLVDLGDMTMTRTIVTISGNCTMN
jgi:hypothetical protein